MNRHPAFGVLLAAFGALVLTPDAMLMRLSQMDGFQMAAWRGLFMGSVMVLAWVLISRTRARDLAVLRTPAGLALVGCQFFNSMLFSLGIALAPAAVVLFGVAAVPVFAALLSWLLLGEVTRPATWVAIAAVFGGIGIAVLGGEADGLVLDARALIGALFGLGVALMLAMNFVMLRARPQLPILLVIGCGAWAAGLTGTVITGLDAMGNGQVWAMAVTGAVVLPVSFFALSSAARYTHAANVSLLMLLETVLGPLWVWAGVGERPTMMMALGGAIVVVSLAVYLLITGRRTGPRT